MNHSRRPPGFRSQLKACALKCSSRMPPWPCTIAFGRPGGAGREEHEERVVERHRHELERAGLGDQLGPGQRVGELVLAVRHVHDVLQRRQGGADRRDLVAAVDRAVAVAVAGDGEQDRRLELREAVDHAARAELGRAAGPDRAQARGRGERDDRLGDVRQVGDDAVARPDAEPLESRARTRDLLAELAERELARRRASASGRRSRPCRRPRRRRRRCSAKLSRAPGNQRGAGHLVGREHGAVRRVRLDLEEVPDRRPEPLEVVDRPALQLLVAWRTSGPRSRASQAT